MIRTRWSGVAAAAAPIVVVALAVPLAGQSSSAPPLVITAYGNHPPARPYVTPKTPWGEPDLQGTWTSDDTDGIPMSRPAQRGTQLYLTDQELAQREKTIEEGVKRATTEATSTFRFDFGRRAFPQTSLIVDPPNGRLPELTPEGKRRAAEMRSSWGLPGEKLTFDWVTDFDSWDRCITRGMPSSMFPYRYNNGLHILQAPGLVVLDLEMIHESRIVYTDGRPSLSPAIKQYMGESRGHWDGNTLVVVTTNYKEGPSGTNIGVAGSPQGNRWPVSDQMKTTERFTRLNNDMWLYEVKTEDPVVMTRPYTVRFPMRNDPSYEWWEYACHEGNSVIPNYVTTSRFERANPQPADAAPAGGRGQGGGGGRGQGAGRGN
jgi:hypothetical protein